MQNGSGVGIFLVKPQRDCISKSYKIAFSCTNNITEYKVLITGLRLAIQWRINEFQVYGDSQLVIKQVNDEYQTKDDKLLPYHNMVEAVKKHFTLIQFDQIPRMNNRVTDAMATNGSLLQMSANSQNCEFLVEQLLIPTYDVPKFEMVCVITGSKSPWYQETFTFPQDNIITPHLTKT